MHDMMDIEEEDEQESQQQSSPKRRARDFDEMINDSSDDERQTYNDDLREQLGGRSRSKQYCYQQ